MQYRLNTPAMGILKIDGRTIFVTLPAGTILAVDDPLPRIGVAIEVDWSGLPVRVFPIDILQRAEIVQPLAMHMSA